MSIGGRFGQFLVVIGIFLIFLFFLSDLGKQPQFNMLFAGLFLVAIGAILLIRGAEPRQSSGRFRTAKKIWNRNKNKEEDGGEE